MLKQVVQQALPWLRTPQIYCWVTWPRLKTLLSTLRITSLPRLMDKQSEIKWVISR